MDYTKITKQLEELKADRAKILIDYPDLHEWEPVDDEMSAWINHEYVSGQIHALESILGMESTFGNDSNGMDKISIIWGIDDVHHIADQELSDDEAREVLRRAEHYHDASIGINWEVLDVWADMVINERGEK